MLELEALARKFEQDIRLDKERSANDSYKQAELSDMDQKHCPSFGINSNTYANSLDDEILEENDSDAGKSSPATSSLTSFAHHDEPLPAESKVSLASSY